MTAVALIGWGLVSLISLFLYLLPTIAAFNRHHHNAVPIMLVNLVFGWTVLGWFAAFVWALTRVETER